MRGKCTGCLLRQSAVLGGKKGQENDSDAEYSLEAASTLSALPK